MNIVIHAESDRVNLMKKLPVFVCSFAVALVGFLSTGCRSSLSVPFVDLSLGTEGHKHSHRSKNHRLEHKINELEEQNQELRERVEELEESGE